jgi:hypothetical protein
MVFQPREIEINGRLYRRVEETAADIGYTSWWIRESARNGKIPCEKVKGVVYFNLDDVKSALGLEQNLERETINDDLFACLQGI